jgi:hypothetical protein
LSEGNGVDAESGAGVLYGVLNDARDSGALTQAGPGQVLDQAPPAPEILAALQGTWAFQVDQPMPGSPLLMSIRAMDSELEVELDGELVPARLVGEDLEILLHRENAGGFAVLLQLVGNLREDQLVGTVHMIEGETNQANLNASQFTARRAPVSDWQPGPRGNPEPFDIAGVWQRTVGVGPLGRTNPHLNAAGLEVFQGYESGLYDPALRCMPVGLMRKYADPGLLEFMQTDERITLLYQSRSDVRRIFLDRDQHSAERIPDLMGESIGYWDGPVLVISTAHMKPTVLTHNSEPISANARILERYWLEPDGALTKEAVLHDPDYYQAPVVRRTQWVRAQNAEFVTLPCDPDSFYKGLHFETRLGEYFDNQPAS